MALPSYGASILEEIVVTAQKREQNVNDIGGAITAISGDLFRELGMENVADVASFTPNLNYSSPSGAGSNPSLSIRGIGMNDFSDTNEGPISMYIDEIYYGTLAGQTAALFDLDRVEVLRGPQGTLYGRNTTGGLVHFVTKKPTEEFEAFGELTYGSYDRIKVEAAAGGALTDTLRARAAFYHDSDDGVQKDRGTGNRGQGKDVNGYRLQMEFDATDEVEVYFNVHGSVTRNDAQFYKHRGTLDAARAPCSVADVEARNCFDVFGFQDPDSDPFSVLTTATGPTPLDIDTFGVIGKVTWQRDGWGFTSITGHEKAEKFHRDITFPGPALTIQPFFELDSEQFTQEFRLSHSSDALTWMLGAFYFDDNKNGDGAHDGFSFGPGGPITRDHLFDQDTEALAIFTHADWQFAENWNLELGLRFSEEEKEAFADVDGLTQFPRVFTFTDTRKTDNVSWNIGLDWAFDENSLLYANIARGFKSGGWNISGNIFFVEQFEPYDDEILQSYEVGLKTALLDGKLQLNVSGFYYDYEDLQVFSQFVFMNAPISRLSNAGDAKNLGFELELLYAPVDYFQAQIGIGYLDTETADFFSVEGLDAVGNEIIEDLSGSELTLSPKWNTSGIFRVFHPMFNGEASAQLSVNYSSSYFFDSDNSPISVGGDYTLLNIRVGWKSVGDRYEISAFIHNLTDKDYIVEGFNIAGAQSLMYNRPREAGISFRVNF